jgi:predicted ArsR family transcriptional regulator
MSDRERTDSGTFVETVTLDDVLGVFNKVRGPVITSSDVAEQLECSTEAARQKLTRLYARGEVDKRKTGRTTVWWHTGGDRITPDERAVEEDAERARERREKRGENQAGSTTDDAEQPAETPEATAWMPDLRNTLPGKGDNLDGRVQAVRDIHDYLKEHGEGKRGDFEAVVDVQATGYDSFQSFWTNCINDTGVLKELPGVKAPGEGGHTYRYDP